MHIGRRKALALLAYLAVTVERHQRDALATLEYTWAAIESYENGGVLVRPHALPTLKRTPGA